MAIPSRSCRNGRGSDQGNTPDAEALGQRGFGAFQCNLEPVIFEPRLYLYNEGQVRIWPYDRAEGGNTIDVLGRLRAEIPTGTLIVLVGRGALSSRQRRSGPSRGAWASICCRCPATVLT